MTQISTLGPEVKIWRIKAVYRGTPNADGFWIDCGTHQIPSKERFSVTAKRLSRFAPRDHEIVAMETR